MNTNEFDFQMEKESSKSVVPVFVFFLLLLLGALSFGTYGIIEALGTYGWTKTNGTVISAEVKRVTSSKGSAKYLPVISYSYVIDTATYQSDRYSSTAARGTSQWANQIISQYPPKSSRFVYYNPKNQKESVLERGLQSDNYWFFLGPLFFFAVVFWGLIRQIKIQKRILTDNQ